MMPFICNIKAEYKSKTIRLHGIGTSNYVTCSYPTLPLPPRTFSIAEKLWQILSYSEILKVFQLRRRRSQAISVYIISRFYF